MTVYNEDNLEKNINAITSLDDGVLNSRAPDTRIALPASYEPDGLALVENSPVMLARWTFDENAQGLNFSYASQNINQLGISAESLVSGEIQWIDFIHPDDLEQIKVNVLMALKQNIAYYSNCYRVKLRSSEYGWLEEHGSIIKDAHGQVEYFQSLLIDITERKKTEAELKKNNNYFKALHDIQQATSDKLEPAQLFKAIAKSTLEAFDYTKVNVGIFENGYLNNIAIEQSSKRVVDKTKKSNKIPLTEPSLQPLINSKEAQFTTRIIEVDDSSGQNSQKTERSILMLPLMDQGELIGAMSVSSDTRTLTNEDMELMTRVGKQLRTTIENAQLHLRLRKDLLRFEAFHKISQAFQEGERLEKLMETITATVCEVSSADWCSLYKVNFEEELVELSIMSKNSPLKLLSYEELQQGLPGQAIQERKLQTLTNEQRNNFDSVAPEHSDAIGIGATIIVPLIYQEHFLGLLSVINHNSKDDFSSEDSYLLESIAGQIALVLSQYELNDKIEYQAYHDVLTALPNRFLYEDRITQAIATSSRNESIFATMFIDLDGFKNVNDTLGHDVGDNLLQQVAARFVARTRKQDTLARMGGDEFALIISDLRTKEDAIRVAKDYLALFDEVFVVAQYSLKISASIGISFFPDDGTESSVLLKHADSAMYKAKELGKNTIYTFTPDLAIKARERLDLENDLQQAIAKGELELYYQAQMSLDSKKLIGVEALLRWFHKGETIISPAQFIPIAEDSRLILDLGKWVLNEACKQNALWQKQGHDPITVAVNISSVQFEASDFIEIVQSALDVSGMDAKYLELELTESVLMRDVDLVIERLNTLRSMGISIAIDDFGTGYSSMQYLQQLPLDKLKIDRSFIEKMNKGADAPIVTSILSLAQSLGLKTVAEGIEQPEQIEPLSLLGCDEAQGFYYAKPVKATELWGGKHNEPIENKAAEHKPTEHEAIELKATSKAVGNDGSTP